LNIKTEVKKEIGKLKKGFAELELIVEEFVTKVELNTLTNSIERLELLLADFLKDEGVEENVAKLLAKGRKSDAILVYANSLDRGKFFTSTFLIEKMNDIEIDTDMLEKIRPKMLHFENGSTMEVFLKRMEKDGLLVRARRYVDPKERFDTRNFGGQNFYQISEKGVEKVALILQKNF
jgi:hypothetical protein